MVDGPTSVAASLATAAPDRDDNPGDAGGGGTEAQDTNNRLTAPEGRNTNGQQETENGKCDCVLGMRMGHKANLPTKTMTIWMNRIHAELMR
ncbi:MAG: hypothetical protein OHK0012_19630 [Synechococcales cyanobacterium]